MQLLLKGVLYNTTCPGLSSSLGHMRMRKLPICRYTGILLSELACSVYEHLGFTLFWRFTRGA